MTRPANGDVARASVSPRALAELARSGSSILRHPSMRVAFEVHHVADRRGYLSDVLQGRYPDGAGALDTAPPPFVETLSGVGYGIGVVIGTRTLDADFELNAQPGLAGPKGIRRLDLPGEGTLFYGTAAPNITFINETSSLFEGLISVEVDPVPVQYRHGRAIRAILEKVTEISEELAVAPILSVHSPAQLPTDGEVADDILARHTTWERSSALALRFSIPLDRTSASLRLRIADAFATYCRDHGLGLWLADIRPGYRTGNWFAICHHDERRARQSFDAALDRAGASDVYACLPVTFVGPARAGAARAIMGLLSAFPQVGVVACSGAIIDDITFINLQLTVNGVPPSDLARLNEKLDNLTSLDDGPATLIPRCVRLLLGDGHDDREWTATRPSVDAIIDYQVAVGPAMPLRPMDPDRRALWVSWEVDGREVELRLPFLALYSAFEHLGLLSADGREDGRPVTGPNVEYLICRHLGNSVLRGKGKISLSPKTAYRYFTGSDPQKALSALSFQIESAWRDRLDTARRARELTVSWREYWLGHWTLPLD
jgi:hypothetical protein